MVAAVLRSVNGARDDTVDDSIRRCAYAAAHPHNRVGSCM